MWASSDREGLSHGQWHQMIVGQFLMTCWDPIWGVNIMLVLQAPGTLSCPASFSTLFRTSNEIQRAPEARPPSMAEAFPRPRSLAPMPARLQRSLGSPATRLPNTRGAPEQISGKGLAGRLRRRVPDGLDRFVALSDRDGTFHPTSGAPIRTSSSTVDPFRPP
jgi:hypothetical protein